MTRIITLLGSLLVLAGCDMGTYTPGLHHGGNSAMTGSMLQGTDTGVETGVDNQNVHQLPTGTAGGH